MAYFIWSICSLNKQCFKRSIVARYWNQLADLLDFFIWVQTRAWSNFQISKWMIIYVFPLFTTWRQSCPIDGLFYCFQFETSIVNKRLLRIGILSTDNDFSINVYFLIHGREVNQRIIMRPLLHSPNTVFNLTRNSLVWKQLSRSRCNYDLLRWTWGYYL